MVECSTHVFLMPDITRLQELHTEVTGKKQRRKELSNTFKDELAQHERYQQILEEMDALKAEKRGIEDTIRAGAPKESAELDDLKIEIKADEELMSDLAMTLIMQNETVELVDPHMNRYVAHLHVKFKKDGTADVEAHAGPVEA